MAKKKEGEDLNCLIKLFVKGFEYLYQYNLKSHLRNYYEIYFSYELLCIY